MRYRSHISATMLSLGISVAVVGCGGSGDDSSTEVPTVVDTTTTSTDTSTTTSTSTVEAINVLATAYPSSLALSLFPQDTTTTALTQAAKTKMGESGKKKKQQAEAILKGEGDSCLPEVFGKTLSSSAVSCYEFDQEMIFGNFQSDMGTLDGTNGAGEACLVSFARAQVVEVENIVDRALGLMQSMMCQAKKDGKAELPAIGETLDLATELGKGLGTKASKVTAATIKRLADENAKPVYRSDITISMADGVTQELHLVHSPAADGTNNSYEGKLWTKVTGFNGSGGNQAGPSDNYLSIQYANIANDDGTSNMQAQLLRGRLAESLAEKAFVKGVLDLNVGADFSGQSTDNTYGQYLDPATNQPTQNSNQFISGMMFIGFNVNSDTGAGTVSYWQNPGGNYTENARGMVFNLMAADDGKLLGCGNSGAAGSGPNSSISIRKAIKEGLELKAQGFYHPFFNTNTNSMPGNNCTVTQGSDTNGSFYQKDCTGNMTTNAKWYLPSIADTSLATPFVTEQTGTLISKQCVKQNAEGLYAIDTDKTTETAGFNIINASNAAAEDIVKPPVLSGLKDLAVE